METVLSSPMSKKTKPYVGIYLVLRFVGAKQMLKEDSEGPSGGISRSTQGVSAAAQEKPQRYLSRGQIGIREGMP